MNQSDLIRWAGEVSRQEYPNDGRKFLRLVGD